MNYVECSICSDRFGLTESNDETVTPCGHVFHGACLSSWLLSGYVCLFIISNHLKVFGFASDWTRWNVCLKLNRFQFHNAVLVYSAKYVWNNNLTLLTNCVQFICSQNKSCPECRYSITPNDCRRVYFRYAAVADNVQVYIDYLSKALTDKSSELENCRYLWGKLQRELSNQIRSGDGEYKKLEKKYEAVKMKAKELDMQAERDGRKVGFHFLSVGII